MEGIRDGFASDDCFVCGLLWPAARPCPRCRGSVQWVGAAMMDAGVVMVRLARAYDDWQCDGDVESLARLLTAIHLDGDEAIELLPELGTDLEQLRRAWQRLAPQWSPAWD